MDKQRITELIKECISESLDECLEEMKKNRHTKSVLKEFYLNIRSYGGIQKLFKALNETSPEYANEVEQVYIQAIEDAIQYN